MSGKTKRVAVVLVHGVADQKPDETVRSGVDLLTQFCGEKYSSFSEARVRMPVGKLSLPSEEVSRDVRFSADRLAGYDPASEDHRDDRVYATPRLRSNRVVEGDVRGVDLHEFYWADLSRAGTSALQWLMELYDLTFLFNTVGGQVIRAAEDATGQDEDKGWKIMRLLHVAINYLLTRIILTLNLMMLWMVLPFFLARLPQTAWTGTLAITVGLSTLIGLWLFSGKIAGKSYLVLVLIAIVSAVAGWGARQFYCYHFKIFGPMPVAWVTAAISWCALSYLVVIVLGKRMEGNIRWHRFCTGGACALAAVVLATQWHFDPKEITGEVGVNWIIDRTLRAAEGIYLILVVAWQVLFIAILVFLFHAWISLPRMTSIWNAAARRARWTAALSVFLPFVAITLLNLTIWAAVLQSLPLAVGPATFASAAPCNPEAKQPHDNRADATSSAQSLPPETHEVIEGQSRPNNALESTRHNPIFKGEQAGWRRNVESVVRKNLGSYYPVYALENNTASKAIDALSSAISTHLLPMLSILILGVGASVWGLDRSIRAEIRPSSANADGRIEASKEHGAIIDRMFLNLGRTGRIMCAATIVLPLLPLLSRTGVFGAVATSYSDFIKMAAGPLQLLLGSGLLALILGRGALRWLMLGLRTALDVGLDVLNWMRCSPRGFTPRARIMSRAAALLRYLDRWKDENGNGYDAIIIMAHSQGTVIYTDTLRYLTQTQTLPSAPVHLFTMGSPLRQLYALRFPNLYGWIHRDGRQDGRMSSVGNRFGPSLTECGVVRWWNFYRSGDYVGRYIFLQALAPTDETYDPKQSSMKSDAITEKCIGAGAHTHYWDEQGEEIAKTLDYLIASA